MLARVPSLVGNYELYYFQECEFFIAAVAIARSTSL
jgi:hypothetical protein